MGRFVPILLLVLVVGCAEKPEKLADPPKEPQSTSMNDRSPGDGGVGIVSPDTGAVSPVTGSDSVTGSGGSALGQTAKNMAKNAATKAGGSSLGQSSDN